MSRCSLLLPAATLLFSVAPIALPPAAFAQTGPSGWKTEAVGKNAVMTPPDLAPGEFYQIVVFPRQSQGKALITDFLDAFSNKDVAGRGKVQAQPPPASAKDHTFATAVRGFVTPQGAVRIALYMAFCVDGDNARVVGILSSAQGDLLTRYQEQQVAVIQYVVTKEKTDAEASGRGLALEKLPTTPEGMTPGGKIVPGIYAGNAVYSDDGKIRDRYRLYLYASGEFLLCDAAGEKVEFGDGDYFYDSITGKMAIGRTFHLNNSSYKPDEDFCLYGHGADGKPYIHASSYRGFGWQTTILRYVGPLDRPSPKQAEAQQAAQEAEAKRYKFVTAPGKGVHLAQIAGVLYHQTLKQGDGVSSKSETYLLLKDGTIHDGLPVAPDELDVSLSRRREPEKWGRWRKQGSVYAAAWPDQPNHFEPLQGEMALPAQRGERLAGRFGTGSTSGSMVFGGGWNLWGVTFSPGDRFLKDRQGGYSSGSLGQTMNGFSADTAYDDEGSSTLAISPGVSVSASSKKPGGHRGGTYSLSGYTLTLRYEDGRVARLPFFFTSAKRSGIYFEGTNMTHDDGK